MRYERKYRIEGLPPAWVEQAIRLHPASFRPLYPTRRINNIYFDTPDLSGFYQNIAGVPQRRKHRLRWYGEDLITLTKPVFEIKIKDGELGTKEHQQLPTTHWLQLRERFVEVPHLEFLPLQPVLVNAYQRAYFATPDKCFRLTVDWNLSFAPFHWSKPVEQFHYLPDTAVIVELKYDADQDEAAQRIFDHLPFRQTKNSKYVTGINLIMG
jgi:hypothetical protein